MNAARSALLASAWAAWACGGSPVRGGYIAKEAHPAELKTLARFVPGHCEDAAHTDLAPRVESVEILETATGRPLLVEHRQGHDRLVAENHYDEGPFWVFQLVLKGDSLVRQWRIPRSAGGTGALLAGRELAEVARGQGFQARLASVAISCSLVPEASVLPHGSTNRVP